MREQTDLRLGIEADFVPGAEDRIANLLDARDFDYVVGSVPLILGGAVDMDDYSVWESNPTRPRSVEEIWTRYFQEVGEAARSGLFDLLEVARPDLLDAARAGGIRLPHAVVVHVDGAAAHEVHGADDGVVEVARVQQVGDAILGARDEVGLDAQPAGRSARARTRSTGGVPSSA